MVHDRVRWQMQALLQSDVSPAFLDTTALAALGSARRHYIDANLVVEQIIPEGKDTLVFTWCTATLNIDPPRG